MLPKTRVDIYKGPKYPEFFPDLIDAELDFVPYTLSDGFSGEDTLINHIPGNILREFSIWLLALSAELGLERPKTLQDVEATQEHKREIESIFRLLKEQDFYVRYRDKFCEVYAVVAWIGEIVYGATFVFVPPEGDSVVMQGITKYFLPFVLKSLRPDIEKKLPRLNSLLLPQVEMIARSSGKRKIFVNPIGKQGYFLETYYGFTRTNEQMIRPCKIVFKTEEKESTGVYFKELPQE